jgi:thiamine biosynthesis lipoprotein
MIHRPPGLGFDTGGTGKGLAADLLAERFQGYSQFVIDCGGDIRVGGFGATPESPFTIEVEHPLSGEHGHALRLVAGGVATSGLNIRVWRGEDGRYAHHLLDPSTGAPAWTGLIGATAVGDTALEAETLSKAALLSGPSGARRFLARRGGLLVHDDGSEEVVGALDAWPRVTVAVPRALADRAGMVA